MRWIIINVGFAVLIVSLEGSTVSPVFAQGCAMCQTVLPQVDEPIARGMFWCVMILLTAPFVVCAMVGGWLVYHYRCATSGHDLAAFVPTLHTAKLQEQEKV